MTQYEVSRLLRPTLPPVFGATLAAASGVGLDTGESFRVAFEATYEKAPQVEG